MAKEMTLADLFYDTLKDIYFAERQILKALPKMARAAQALASAFTRFISSSVPLKTCPETP